MPRVSIWFFAVAVIYGTLGMLWGIHMGATENHAMLPAHAHLNLLGLVVMAIYGTFYALAGRAASRRNAWITFGLANVGVVLTIPTLAMILTAGPQPAYLPIIMAGEVALVAGMVSFGVSVWKLLLAGEQADIRAAATAPAE